MPNSKSKQTGPMIPYTLAFDRLKKRLHATQEEIAAWVFLGPEEGGIAAYLSSNESNDPQRFFFDYFDYHNEDFDYVSPLMDCWFSTDEIVKFKPIDRFITGEKLIDRWNSAQGIKAKALIKNMISEGELIDLHPVTGLTEWSMREGFPPKETALFKLADVKRIENENKISPSASVPAERLSQLILPDRYEPSTQLRDRRKLERHARYLVWREEARKLRKKDRPKSERWIAKRIAKMSIAKGAKWETIRKKIRE